MNQNKHEFYTLPKEEQIVRLKEITIVFLRLGTTAFGGPAAHVAMMDDEIVKKRNWLTKEEFLDLYGATNLLPGPNSTELAIHLGYVRGGWKGLILAGFSFIVPAVVIVLILASIYSQYGSLPQLSGIMYGIKPVIIAVVLQALIRMGKSAIKGWVAAGLAVLATLLTFIGIHELTLLFGIGIVMMLIVNYKKVMNQLPILIPMVPLASISTNITAQETVMPLTSIFLIFLKIGSVLYGSGYVLLAFLEADFVVRLGVLTNQQLLDAISIGQFTPGPVFTTATFIGYLLQGTWGAMFATIGIFLPSFVLVGLLHSVIPKLRNSTWIGGLLDGINVASWALMAVVSFKLGASALIDVPAILIFMVSLTLILKTKLNTAWLILAGAFIGLLLTMIG